MTKGDSLSFALKTDHNIKINLDWYYLYLLKERQLLAGFGGQVGNLWKRFFRKRPDKGNKIDKRSWTKVSSRI